VTSVTTLSADSYLAENTPENPNRVQPRADRQILSGNTIRLLRHSLTIIEFLKR
jgi:hypothetical protein